MTAKLVTRNRARILVVDDEAKATEMLDRFLTRRGYSVMTARDGEEESKLFAARGAEMVITDYRMPRKDGRSLINELWAAKPGLPIIVVSGSLHVLELTASLAEEDIYVLAKPIDLRSLPGLIQGLLDGSGGER